MQIATNDRGARLARDLAARMGWDAIAAAIEDLLTYTAARLRARVRGNERR